MVNDITYLLVNDEDKILAVSKASTEEEAAKDFINQKQDVKANHIITPQEYNDNRLLAAYESNLEIYYS